MTAYCLDPGCGWTDSTDQYDKRAERHVKETGHSIATSTARTS